MTEAKATTVRMRAETFALFEQMLRRLNAQLPFGSISKTDLLDACVSSASAAMAEGRFHMGGSRERKDDRAA